MDVTVPFSPLIPAVPFISCAKVTAFAECPTVNNNRAASPIINFLKLCIIYNSPSCECPLWREGVSPTKMFRESLNGSSLRIRLLGLLPHEYSASCVPKSPITRKNKKNYQGKPKSGFSTIHKAGQIHRRISVANAHTYIYCKRHAKERSSVRFRGVY